MREGNFEKIAREICILGGCRVVPKLFLSEKCLMVKLSIKVS